MNARDVGSIGRRVRGIDNRESAFLQDADRAGVVLGGAGGERAGRFQAEEGGEGGGRDAAAPEGAAEPVADFSFSVGGPTVDVAGDLLPRGGVR